MSVEATPSVTAPVAAPAVITTPALESSAAPTAVMAEANVAQATPNEAQAKKLDVIA